MTEQERQAAVARVVARGRTEAAKGEDGLTEYVVSAKLMNAIQALGVAEIAEQDAADRLTSCRNREAEVSCALVEARIKVSAARQAMLLIAREEGTL